jgi:hypothetical protein
MFYFHILVNEWIINAVKFPIIIILSLDALVGLLQLQRSHTVLRPADCDCAVEKISEN